MLRQRRQPARIDGRSDRGVASRGMQLHLTVMVVMWSVLTTKGGGVVKLTSVDPASAA
jgi:hypothetical protein